MKGIKGKTVIITGGARGIGKACVTAFSKAGAKVVFTYNKSSEEAKCLEKSAKDIIGIKADIKEYAECRAVIEQALKKFKKIKLSYRIMLFIISHHMWNQIFVNWKVF